MPILADVNTSFASAWFVSNSQRKATLLVFFQVLRELVPTWAPQAIMTDLAESAFNALKEIFPNVQWLWCLFHVKQALHKTLPTKLQWDRRIPKEEWLDVQRLIYRSVLALVGGSAAQYDSFRLQPRSEAQHAQQIEDVKALHALYAQADH